VRGLATDTFLQLPTIERTSHACAHVMTQERGRKTIWNRHRVGPRTEQRTRGSRWLYRIDHYSSQPVVALTVIALLLSAIIVGIAFGFPTRWVTAFETATAAVTLLMVFVIQHTQAREQAATQRKLDELLRALPNARNDLMMLEEASEETMQKIEGGQRDLKRSRTG
jgi:low affinity Fe/Cu permease